MVINVHSRYNVGFRIILIFVAEIDLSTGLDFFSFILENMKKMFLGIQRWGRFSRHVQRISYGNYPIPTTMHR